MLVEFVSANPTGPLHVGHGRHAAFGASVANLLEAVGYRVAREYYINDAGRQMEILAASTWLRYLERCGERFAFPANGYRGDYIVAIADALYAAGEPRCGATPPKSSRISRPTSRRAATRTSTSMRSSPARGALLGDAAFRGVLDHALGGILADIREDLEEFGVTFDSWFSERSLDRQRLHRSGHRGANGGAATPTEGRRVWFRSTDYGDEKDRVMVRENGIKTYFASDIAFVFNKRERGFEHLLYIWGADHHGYIARLRAGLVALGGPAGVLRGAPGAVRLAVSRRREGADVDALGRVRHLARAAQRRWATMRRGCSTSCAATISTWISTWSSPRRDPTTTRCTTFNMRTRASRA